MDAYDRCVFEGENAVKVALGKPTMPPVAQGPNHLRGSERFGQAAHHELDNVTKRRNLNYATTAIRVKRQNVVDELDEILDCTELREDLAEVTDVVSAVAKRGVVERRQPDAVNAQPLQVIELLGHTRERTGAGVVGVVKSADQDLVENRVLVPLVIRALPRIIARGGGRGFVLFRLRLNEVSFSVNLGAGFIGGGGLFVHGFQRKEIIRMLHRGFGAGACSGGWARGVRGGGHLDESTLSK